jgi:hypothetical protein
LKANKFIATLGFILLGGILVTAVVFGVFFVVPELNVMGITAVNERNSQTMYKDDIIKKTIFPSGNIIIESETAEIEILMTQEGQAAENTISVEESAMGISFNSVDHTHVEWTEVLVDDDANTATPKVKYYKLKILEPKGAVVKDKPTKVFINPKVDENVRYRFILNTNFSKVNFNITDNSKKFFIDKLTVENARFVNLNSQNITVQDVVVKSDLTALDISKSEVKGNVNVEGSGVNVQLYEVGGNLTVGGENNVLRASGNVTGNVNWTCDFGELVLMKECGGLTVESDYAAITANAIKGNVRMISDAVGGKPINLKFKVGLITNPTLYIRGYDGNITVGNILGQVDIETKKGAAGFANIDLHFARVIGANKIIASGYPIGHLDIAKISVDVNAGDNFTLKIRNTEFIENYFDNRILDNISDWIFGTLDDQTANQTIEIDTPSVFIIK